MNISIIGAGYVGLSQAVCMAECGHSIYIYDTNNDKISKLINHEIPFYENGLKQAILKNRNRLHFSTDERTVLENSDIIFLCVNTPEKTNGSSNLHYFNNAVKSLIKFAKNSSIIVIKSSVPIGTCENLSKELNNVRKDLKLIYNPEFLSQGTALHDVMHPQRIIIGGKCDRTKNIIKNLYNKIKTTFFMTTFINAEMIKYASNSFLAIKLSYINELANLCEKVGGDIEEIAYGVGLDSRIGSEYLKAGLGFGGSCLIKDSKSLIYVAKKFNQEMALTKTALEFNDKQAYYLLNKYLSQNNAKDKKVAILGMSFKKDTDDLRHSIAIKNVEKIISLGSEVYVYDPVAVTKIKECKLKIHCEKTIEETLNNADVCFIFTDWNEILSLNPTVFTQLMKRPLVYDGKNCYNKFEMIKQGIEYYCIGK